MKMTLSKAALVAFFVGALGVDAVHAATSLSLPQTPRIRDSVPESKFSKTIEDLPLMSGLEVVGGQDVLFVFGSDRIAQTTVSGHVDIDEVYYFYQETLPQLGWSETTPRLYERNGERLRIEASSANADGKTYVRFEVEPSQSPQK